MYLDSLESLVRDISQQLTDQVDRIGRCSRLENAAPRMGADLRELELLIVGVHALQLILGGSTQYLQRPFVSIRPH